MASGNARVAEKKVFRPTTPHFFKIILQQTLDDSKLVLPKRFARIYGTDLSDSVLLKVPSGDEWRVELFRSDGDVYFRNGWGEFVKHYSVAVGHFVVFEYKSSSCFDVLIFDTSATEIDYPILVKEKPKDDEAKGTDDVELTLPSDDANSALPRKRKRNSAASESSRPSNVEASYGSESHGMNPKIPQAGRTLAGDREMPATEGKLHKVTEPNKKLSKEEKTTALQRAKESFSSKNPHFMVLMQASYVDGWQLLIPFKFMERNFVEKVGTVSLQVSGQGTWTVDFSVQDSKRLAFLKSNWRAFAQDNNLKLGDVCIFELLRGAELAFKVTIFRMDEGASSGKPADKSPTQVDYPMLVNGSRKMSKDKEVRETDNENLVILSDDSDLPFPHKRKRTNVAFKFTSPSKVQTSVSVDGKESDEINLNKSRTVTDKRDIYSKNHGALLAANCFTSKNPFFKVVFRSSKSERRNVCIPIEFMKNHIKEIEKTAPAYLQNGKGRWPVNLLTYPHRNACISGGWPKFESDNGIQPGDVCIFELIRKYPLLLNVSIFKHAA